MRGVGRVRAGGLRDSVIEVLGDEAVPVAAASRTAGQPWADHRVGRDELDRLLQRDTTFAEVSGGVVFVPAMLDGTAWTVWIDPADGAEGSCGCIRRCRRWAGG